MAAPDFTSLLAPLDVPAFMADHWERAPLLSPGAADRFADLLRVEEVEHLFVIAPDRPNQPGAAAVREDDGELRTHPVDTTGRPGRSRSAMAEAMATGHTIVVNGLAWSHPAVSRLCADAAENLQHTTSCNLYMTPPGSTGFLPHHDDHDTFFLQVAGSKRWRLWAPDDPLPIGLAPPEGTAPDRAPDRELVLRRGEVLYVPRGWVHSGQATDELSLHLTLGVLPTTWYDLLGGVLRAAAADDVELRRSLPMTPGATASPSSSADLVAHGRNLLTRIDGALVDLVPRALVEVLVARIDREEPPLDPHLAFTAAREAITVDTVVERRPGLAPVVAVMPGRSRISFPGSYVDGPEVAAPAMRALAGCRQITVGQLPDLPDAARVALVSQLVLQGMLRPVAS